MTNYSLGDFLIKIKNISLSGKNEVTVPYTKLNHAVSEVLMKEKILREVKKEDGLLTIKLAYLKKEPVLMSLKLVSKPGKRVYVKVDDMKVLRGISFYLLSTPKGIMTSKEAIKKNLGGELIAKIQ